MAALPPSPRGFTIATDDPESPCPGIGPWQRFWADPPASLDDPRLAQYLDAEARWAADLAWGENLCPHCVAQFNKLRNHIAMLERGGQP